MEESRYLAAEEGGGGDTWKGSRKNSAENGRARHDRVISRWIIARFACVEAHTFVSRVSLTLPFFPPLPLRPLLSSSRSSNANHHSSSFPILYDYYLSSSSSSFRSSSVRLPLVLRCPLIPLVRWPPPLVFLPFACLPPSLPSCRRLVLLLSTPLLSPPRLFARRQGAGDRSVSCGVPGEPIACVKYRPCRSPWLMNLPSTTRPRVSRPAAGSPRVLASLCPPAYSAPILAIST